MLDIQKIVPVNWDIPKSNSFSSNESDEMYITYEQDVHSIKQKLHLKLAQNSYCVIKYNKIISKEELLNKLQNLFANPMIQTKSIDSYESLIKPILNSTRILHSHSAQTLHVDCGNNNVQPNFVVLHCFQSSEIGGDSIFVHANTIKTYIENLGFSLTELDALYDRRGMSYDRGNIVLSSSIMHKDKHGQPCVSIRYADRMIGKTKIHEQLIEAIITFSHQAQNQKRLKLNDGESLIIDNHKVIHGRSSFQGQRELIRLWYKELL